MLRQAIFGANMTERDVAARMEVDPKTVRRWLEGRLPYRRHRWDLARILSVDETELWPELRAVRAAKSKPNEVTAIYPHRSSVTGDGWRELLESAERAIDILVYSGLFLAENPMLLRILVRKAEAHVPIRVALGDPTSPHVAERGLEEQIGEAMAAKIRNALVLYRPLASLVGVELRLHRTVLYNSIYRVDGQMLVNQHAYGIPAAHAPVYHLRKTEGGEMFQCYLDSFERVWSQASPVETP
jgi:hypothetical protein